MGVAPDKRRLWVGIALYVLVIYVSLPFTRPFLKFIYAQVGRGTVSAAVSAAIVVAASALCLAALRKGPLAFVLIALPLAALVFTTFTLRLPEERVHFVEYGLLGFLLIKANGTTWRRSAFSLALVLAVGGLDEYIQHLLPSRVGDWRDVLMNAAGGVVGLWVGRVWYLP
jgi:hypothetical protein